MSNKFGIALGFGIIEQRKEMKITFDVLVQYFSSLSIFSSFERKYDSINIKIRVQVKMQLIKYNSLAFLAQSRSILF